MQRENHGSLVDRIPKNTYTDIVQKRTWFVFLRLTENSFLAEKRIVTNQIAPFFI